MRITTNKGDPWFTKHGSAYKVKFNNKYIPNCVLADEGLGLIEVYNEDSNGQFVIDNDCIKTHFKTGSVKIERDTIDIIKTSMEYFFIRMGAING